MAPPRASLKGFLATAKKALLAPPAQRPNPLTFVVGNESADLDSLCSALLLAYFRTHTPPHTLHIPLSHLPRADLALRPELSVALSPAGLKPDDLITLSDLPDREGLDAQDTRWLLVDHNVMTGDLGARFGGQVFGCIDHHEDEGIVPSHSSLPPAEQPRLFAKCGSCMSLVLDHCQSNWDALTCACEDGTSAAACDAALARVALAPVLIDTTNLTSKDKTTDWDVRAVKLAEGRLRSALSSLSSASSSSSTGAFSAAATAIGTSPGGTRGGEGAVTEERAYDRARYYDTLSHLREQIASLSYRDILRSDYKRWGEGDLSVGVSTVVQELRYVMTEAGDKSRDAFLDALRAWAGEQGLDVAAVMTVSRPGGVFKRELLVWGMNEQGAKVARGFGKKYKEELGLETWRDGELDGREEECGGKEWRVCWVQKSIQHSRKQVAPMLRDAMKEYSRL